MPKESAQRHPRESRRGGFALGFPGEALVFTDAKGQISSETTLLDDELAETITAPPRARGAATRRPRSGMESWHSQ